MTREPFPEKSLSPALPKRPCISHVPGEIPQGAAAAKPSTFCLDEQLLKVSGSRSAGGHLSADLLQLALHPAAARLKGVLGGNGLQHRVRDVHLQTQGPHINNCRNILEVQTNQSCCFPVSERAKHRCMKLNKSLERKTEGRLAETRGPTARCPCESLP
jgi:hypothetical protein